MAQVSWRGLSLFGAALFAMAYAILPLMVAQGILDYAYYGDLIAASAKTWHPILAIIIGYFASVWVYRVTMDRINGNNRPSWHIHIVVIPAFIASHQLFMAGAPAPLMPSFITLVISQATALGLMCWSTRILDVQFSPAANAYCSFVMEWFKPKKQK